MSNNPQQNNEGDIESGLPEGWVLAKIEDLCTQPQYGWTTSAKKNGAGVKLLRTSDISNGLVNWSMVPFCAEEPDDHEKYLLETGDILVSRAGSVGLSYLVKECPQAIFASYLIRFRPKPPIESEFIALFLKSPKYWALIADQTSGIAIPNVNASKLKQLEIPLPPLAEQKRIVAKVAALLARVNATKERLAKVSMILKRFRQSVLAAACSGRLTADWRNENKTEDEPEGSELPSGWHWVPIKELLPPGGIFDGPFGSNLKTSDYTDNGVQVVRLENVGSLQFFHQKETYISQEKYKILFKHTVGAGDIIFASFIDEEVRACVLPKLKTKAVAKADCFCLRPRQDVVDRHYLTLQLVSQESYDRLSENIHGATRPRINTTQLRNLEVRICPLAEQQEIVRRLEALFKLADIIEKRVAAASLRAEKLTQAIPAKAFRGELVPTEAELACREGRTYESASELLSRIKSERESKGRLESLSRSKGRQKRIR
jgi:type I restriction enzyme S subunit